MGKTVADVAVLDALIAGEPLSSVVPDSLRGVVFCAPSDWIEQLDPGSREALDVSVAALIAGGATVRTDLAFKPVADYKTEAKVNYSETELQKYIDSHPGLTTSVDELLGQCDNPMLLPSYKEGGKGWEKINMATKEGDEAAQLVAAWESEAAAIEAAYAEFFSSNGVDALLTPVHPIAPVRIEGKWEDEAAYSEKGGFAPIFNWMPMARYVRKFNEVKAPSVVVPTPARHPLVEGGTHTEGLPAGVLIWGPPNADGRVLRLGMALEQELLLGAEDELRR
jgi:Asp-tRNA(Asn)/Glu-tRNA(Gln) amidotransferase A subunit family amidase